MKNNLLTVLRGEKSIRVQLLWAVFRSYILALVVLFCIPNYKDEFPTAHFILGVSSFGISFICFFVLFTRNLVKYLSTLTDGLMLIANGDLSYRLPLSRKDELGNIAHNINNMAQQLQKQMARERQIEKSKMELISGISHDLRTPLTSIIGYLDLLKTNTFEDEKERERYINNAFNKTQQLKKLLEDLFEYTRLTNGDNLMTLQEVDFNSLLEQLIIEFEPVAKEQEISVKRSLSSAPCAISIDIEKMVRATDNLLMNALKFSVKPGEIEVKLSDQEDHVTLVIENLGTPISKEQEEQLFERFYKIELSRNDKNMPSGSGLGLSITKNIVELHGGRIWLDHHKGRYKFCIEFPRG